MMKTTLDEPGKSLHELIAEAEADYRASMTNHELSARSGVNSPEQRAKLTSNGAPHETAGVIRMFRSGITGPRLAELNNSSPQLTMLSMRQGMDREDAAKRAGLPIHDAILKKGTK